MAGADRWSWPRVLGADGPAAVICIRVAVGLVFLSEGIQKFLYPDKLGPGRFDKIGIPAPTFFAYFDGVVEIVCGALIVIGLLTRLAALPLLVDISLAIVLTKLRELRPGGFQGVQGFWGMAHDARTDFAMLLGLIFLVWAGPGRWSLDAWLTRRAQVMRSSAMNP
ncbi:DoxX family protein [Nocardia xishanensis]|uniref:DoxX family protein n=1 Tax=Nocardia xishanensis TaxID=238964 RepID=UPI000A892D7C